jgi:hypothetical protein
MTGGSLQGLAVALSVLLIVAYEVRLARAGQRNAAAVARSAHRVLRGEWVTALSRQPGTEILAVQALRNSLMSATITASTAALVLMGCINLFASKGEGMRSWFSEHVLSVRAVLELLLLVTLFAMYVCSAMAMRYYHHAGFVMSLPVGSPERTTHGPIAGPYVQRAGVLYSWSVRCFLYTAPVVMGLLSPVFMPLAAVALLVVLAAFDRAPEPSAD